MQVSGVRVAKCLHLSAEGAVGALVVHLLLFFGGIANATSIEWLHSLAALALQRGRHLLWGEASEHRNHLPSSLLVEVGLFNTSLVKYLIKLQFLQFTQVCFCTCHSLWVLNGRIQVHSVGFGSLDGVCWDLEWHFEVTVAAMAIRWIALAFQHHHTPLLLDFDVVAREIPGCLEDLWFDKLGNSLQDEICFFKAEFVGRVRDLISAEDMLYADLLQSILSMSCTFILAYHLRCHAILVLFHFKVGTEATESISVLINLNLF